MDNIIKMFYENYQDRKNVWLDYFALQVLDSPYYHGHPDRYKHCPERFIPKYLEGDKPNIKLMKDHLATTDNPREIKLLTLLIREFSFENIDWENDVKILPTKPLEERIKKGGECNNIGC